MSSALLMMLRMRSEICKMASVCSCALERCDKSCATSAELPKSIMELLMPESCARRVSISCRAIWARKMRIC